MFADKSVLLTGGSSGIGSSIANSLINFNAKVGIVSRQHPNEWQHSPKSSWDIKNWIKTDLGNFNKQNIKRWLDSVKRLQVLILCANSYGYNKRRPFIETGFKEWNEIFNVNLNSQFQIIKLTLPLLLKSKNALILSITSDVVFESGARRIAYAASKTASHKMFVSLAEELKNTSVSVVELLPTNTVDTPGIRKRRPKNFDFSAYHSPNIFINPTLSLIKKPNKKFSGKCLNVYNDRVNIFNPNPQ